MTSLSIPCRSFTRPLNRVYHSPNCILLSGQHSKTNTSCLEFRCHTKFRKDLVVCKAAKKLTATNAVAVAAELQGGPLLLACNLTFSADPTTKLCSEADLIQGNLGLTSATATKSPSKFGAGQLVYEGAEWYNGEVFVGKNKNNTHIIRLTGRKGAELLQEIVKMGSLDSAVAKATVNQVSYRMRSDAPSTYPNNEAWLNGIVVVSRLQHNGRNPVSVSGSSLCVGQRTNSRSYVVTPTITTAGQVSNLIHTVTLQGKNASSFWAMLRGRSSTFSNYCASDLSSIQQELAENPISVSVKDFINRTFQIGGISARANTPLLVAIPTELKSCKGGCTAILNKLIIPGLSLHAQNIVITNLLLQMEKRQSEITNYTAFKDKIKKALKFP